MVEIKNFVLVSVLDSECRYSEALSQGGIVKNLTPLEVALIRFLLKRRTIKCRNSKESWEQLELNIDLPAGSGGIQKLLRAMRGVALVSCFFGVCIHAPPLAPGVDVDLLMAGGSPSSKTCFDAPFLEAT